MAALTTVVELLAARAAAQPGHVALLVDGRQPLTAAQWHQRATAVARGLLARGVRRGDRVGLVFARAEWVDYAVAFAAVTAAGAIAVPLPADQPEARIAEALADCGARLTLTPSNMDTCEDGELPVVEPSDLAQIIYTSGTTGTPKGVYASHANLTHGIGRLTHSRHVAHAFGLGTNAAQTMLMTSLVAQPTVVVASSFDAPAFARLVERYRAESIFVVPAMAIALLEQADLLSSVELIASSAAPLPPAVALRLAAALPDVTIVNSYTSTEAAPAFTSMIFDPGRPTALGRSGEVKVDDDGQVWLRAPHSRGYFGDVRATAATFVDGWVRTGDLGYLDGDGYLHLIDRVSDVVKTSAHKVSTVRVEDALYEHPSVREAAVAGLPHPTMGTALAAALVLTSGTVADIRSFLTGRLAPHEIPTRYAVMDSLPRNEAGKVVKARLSFDSGPSSPPSTPAEVALAAIWQDLLNVPPTGVDDDFFALGGDSLAATRLAERLGVPVETVFEAPTLAAQAARLTPPCPPILREWPVRHAHSGQMPGHSRKIGAHDRGVVVGRVGAAIELTATQESLLDWMYETDPPRDAGPISVGIRIRDHFDPALLERALRHVITRHESLRTVFDGHRATVLDSCPPVVTIGSSVDELLTDREGHFDLVRGPLVRAVVVRLADDDHVLGLAVHHLVFDGASMGVLLREVGLAYSALRVGVAVTAPSPALDYRDHVAWTRREWARTTPYWTAALDGAPAHLHFARRKHAVRIRHGSMTFDLGPPHVIREIAFANQASTFMVIAACWAAVLAHFADTDDAVLLVPLQGRTRPGSEALIGCVVQSVLLRVGTSGDPTFAQLLGRVRKATLAALDHQFHPFARFFRQHSGASFLRVEHWAGPAHFPGLESEAYALPRALDADWPTPNGGPDLQSPELAVVEQQDGTLAAWLLWNRYAFDQSTMDDVRLTLTRLVAGLAGQTALRLSELLSVREEDQ